jgi:hypothetical protein
MKKLLFPIVAMLITIAACKKKDPPAVLPSIADTTDSNAMTYIVGGLSDMSISWEDEKQMPLAITYTAGDQEQLSLSVEGAPEGVTVSFDVVKGLPPFVSILMIKTNVSKDGVYPLNLICETSKGKKKSFPFTLTIATTDCRDYIPKNVSCINECMNKTTTNVIKKDAVNGDLILIYKIEVTKGGWNAEFIDVPARVNCNNKTFTIEEGEYLNAAGSLDYYYLQGSGSFTNDKVNLEVVFRPMSTLETSTCNYTMTKK